MCCFLIEKHKYHCKQLQLLSEKKDKKILHQFASLFE